MYIKSVIINNFKSYRGLTIIEDFRPCYTAIVGENGAGKSNLLQAIEFVLSCKEEPTKKIATLLSQRATEGFIEVLFLECDSPFENKISIRKEFSLRTNLRFYVNEKKINKKKMMALFEIYGLHFTSSMSSIMVHKFMNYSREKWMTYIVKSMGVAVLQSYNFTQKIFSIFEGQKEELDYLFHFFNKLSIDEDEKYLIQLRKYRNHSNAIKSNILKRKIDAWSLRKIQLEEELNFFKEESCLSSDISLLEHSQEEIQNSLLVKKNILKDLINEECNLIRNKEKVNLLIQDLIKNIEIMKKKTNENADSNKVCIEKKTSLILEELKILANELKLKKDVLTKLNLETELKKEIRLNLLLKIKRGTDCYSKEERNAHLQTQIFSLTAKIEKIEEEVKAFSIRQEELSKVKLCTSKEIEKMKKALEEKELLNQSVIKKKEQLNSFQNIMRDLQRKEEVLEGEISEISQKIQETALKLKKKIGSAIVTGAESILRVIDACKSSENHRWLCENYFGMVVDNFECSEELNIAVETAIGNRLFAHVVTDTKTGTELLKEMNNYHLPGEVWFLPMTNILQFSYNYPTEEDAEPMLNRLSFKPQVERVMKHLFGRIIICRNINVAIDIMKRYTGFICITLEGDKVSAGMIYGGHINKSKCTRTLYLEINFLQNKMSLKTGKLENLRHEINILETDINCTISSIHKSKEKYDNVAIKENLIRLNEDLKSFEKELLNINEQITQRRNIICQLLLTKKMLTDEADEDFEPSNKQAYNEIIKLNKDIKEAKRNINDIILELTVLESKNLKLENDLNHQTKLRELYPLDDSEIKECMKKQQDYVVKDEVIGHRLIVIRKKIEETEKSIVESTNEIHKLEEEINQHKELKLYIFKNETGEKIRRKLKLCNIKINQYESAYNELVYPSKLSNEYTHFSKEMLYEEQKKVNKLLKSFSTNSTIEKKKRKQIALYKKYDKLQNSFSFNYVIYGEFVGWLHNYMDKTLNNISDSFTEIFRKITYGGEGNLFVDDDGTSGNWPESENITSLQICVKFPASAESWNLLNLSSSQKALVFFALNFSILQVCPVPICILDEIDRPLTDEQKKLLGHYISKLGESIQTFSSSHSLEWVKLAKNYYSITFKNMKSRVQQLTEKEVYDLLRTKKTSRCGSFSLSPESESTSVSSLWS